MLNDVAFGPVLEQPAGKIALPAVVGKVKDIELDKGPHFLWPFPLRGPFTRAQPHHRAPDAQRFARFQRHIAYQAIAFVEKAEHHDPLSHRGHPRHAGIDIARRG